MPKVWNGRNYVWTDCFSNDKEGTNMKCCLCNKEIEGYGNNPYPVVDNPGLRCCDTCNFTVVLPARLKLSKEGNTNENSN